MRDFFWVFLGGGCGACARYGTSLVLQHLHRPVLPVATLCANVAGSLLIGIAAAALLVPEQTLMHRTIWLLFSVGFLGGFTTFSTFSLESLQMLQGGHYRHAAAYITVSTLTCLAAVFVGIRAGKAFFA